ncbi:hypothetical protein B0I37DRAFT_437805 [Chaetomium sp. MPI-CAGE-AT-0009]|nr:hypothetical protein B0I37DRAFT_437805 [Chaetomium sp. MPI-CAGE-AT-0009]
MDTAVREVEAALSIVNHPPTRLLGPSLLHLLVQNSSQDGQAAIDFLSPDGSRTFLSYAELHEASEALACRLSALIGPLDSLKPFVIPVLVPQSPELYIALLAILKAGGAFCPMNLDVPVERAKFILEDVSAKVVITTSELAPKLPDGDQAVLLIDGDRCAKLPAVNTHRQPAPTDLAYVMYTSGSTGTPKGVGISHDAATQSLLAHDRHIPQFSRFLQFAAPTFDVSVFEIFFPLYRGKTLVSCARSALLNDLPGVIREMDVDACELTPSVAASLLRKRQNAPGLRLLLTIGEMLTQPVIEEFGGDEERPSILWGMYGPTEASIHCTLQPAFARDSAVRNIGIPLDTVSAFILKIPEEGSTNSDVVVVLGRGEVGELAVGGYQLADGYLNRFEQTSTAFLDSPYGRLYRTGDKARMLADGTLECLGRIADGQVKLRGQRMELGEVEHAALRTPGCHGAVAVVMDATLVLFCAVDGIDNAQDAIMESCRQWLPGFMHPGDIVAMESFPRLPSGKVDRKRLVADYASRTTGTLEKTSYKDELEEKVCDLTSHCLGVNIQPNQDLMRAGLDSLNAIRLASVLKDAGLRVGAIDILEALTASALSSRIRRNTETGGSEPVSTAADPGLDISNVVANSILSTHSFPIEAILPCTPLQSSMLAETTADARAYCNWVELTVAGTHSEETVRSWLSQLARANEVLRTGFIHHNGKFLQVIFEQLPESSISITDSISRDFEFHEDVDFLRPFGAQISLSGSRDSTTVVMQLHHAVYDGWSLDLVRSDLTRLVQGKELNRRPQFRQISAYHLSAKASQTFDAAREFWSQNLLGFQPPALPIFAPEVDRAPEILSSTISLNVSPARVRMALQDIECGPQTIFQAVLAWIWSSMIGVEDVVVGSIQSGRTIPVDKIEAILGPCIAAAPIRTDLSQVRTIRDLLVSINSGNREALPHGALPLSEIKRAAGVRSGQSIYDVLFIYQESLYSKSENTNTVRQVAHRDYLETKLLVEVEPVDKGFDCRLTYHSDTFTGTQIRVLEDLISALIPHVLESIDSDISSFRNACPQHLLSIFNQNPKTFAGISDLATAVEQISAEFPDKDAICFADNISDGVLTTTTITFAELNRMADRIAWHLTQQGVGETGVVAIVMEKSVRLYAGILAILKTGCAYLPLLPSTPTARIETILQQAGVRVCIVDTDTQGKLQQRLQCSFLDLQSLDLLPLSSAFGKPLPGPERLAYIIYTSGSTGIPKGVCLTQRNIMSNLDVLSRIYPVNEDSRLLQCCSQAFDVSVFEIFFAWTQGMCLCSGTNDTLFEDLERSIRKLNVTHLSMTPTVASLVDPIKVPRVQFLVTAGEPMTEAVAQKWGDKLYQGYGPSETTNICSVKKMSSGQAIQHLGWPLENTSTFVLAQGSTEIVPFGCLGEFCFGGDQVAQGYLNLEDLTAAKFIHHPTFGRIYRSGDLGRMLPDGSMVIVGRADEQIKIRGQRVELDEVTEAIRQSEDVDCATLFLKAEDTGTRDQILSFVVLKTNETAKFRALGFDDGVQGRIQSMYHALETRLPVYMLPSAIIPISTLPTTSSGKLDKARLKQAFQNIGHERLALVSYGADQNADDGEWSATETEIAQAISNALNVGRADVQRWTPLATLGLDSISAIQVSRNLSAKLGTRFPVSVVLQNASVARLAKVLPETESREQGQREAPDLLPLDVINNVAEGLTQLGKPFTKILPCTPLQEAMLATSSVEGQYLNNMLFRVIGDLEQLKEAWNAMVARHDILRTCFVATNDARWPILQIALDPWQPSWYDLGSQSDIDGCIHTHAQMMPNAVDSLEPAVSFATFSKNDSVYLSFLCHHALYDGVAIERLLYEVEQHTFNHSLPPTPAYDRFLVQSLTLPATTDSFWLEYLANFEPKLIANVVSTLPKTRTCELAYELDITLSETTARTRELGVSLLALIQTAWATTLARILQSGDVCFGNVVNGRSLPIDGISELVAPCFNTIPIRMDLSRRQRNLDVMRAFHRVNAELMNYQFTPLRRIQSLVSDHDNRGLFDTLLLLQQPSRPLDRALWTLERDDGEMNVPLVCEVIPNGHSNRLMVKMHTVESRPLPHRITKLAYDLFSDALRNCLLFPGSHLAHTSISQGLAEGLHRIECRPPRSAIATTRQTPPAEEWTATEISIREVLEALLPPGSEDIHRNTTIYRLGLDSISAVQIASMLRKRGKQVVASDVIENPTCASLAQFIDTRTPGSGTTSAYDITRFQVQIRAQVISHGIALKTVEAVLPCTPFQSAIMAQFLKSGGRDYFNHADFELEDGLEATRVVKAWQVVLGAHPILRTTIVPVQHDDCAFAMVQYHADMFEHGTDTIIETVSDTFDLHAWKLGASQAAFEPLRPRLWSVAIVQGQTATSMHLAMHHALYDAHSLQSILNDLSLVAMGREILPRPPIAEAIADILGHALSNSESSAKFWKQQAENVVINPFPTMTPLREASREILAESITSTTLLTTLEAAASKSGYPLQVVLQAAWTRVLSAYLGESSVVFGVVLFGRNAEATRNAVFPCITTLPVISSNSDSNQTLLSQMLRYNTNLYKEQHQPLTRLQQWLGCPDSKLFDSLLVYQRLDRDASAEQHWRIVNESANVDYPVSIEVEPKAGGQVQLQITFFSDVLVREQAMLLLKQFDAAVQHLAFSPLEQEADLFRLCPDLFSVLPPATAEISTEVKFLHQFVELRALQAPETTALHFVRGYDRNAPIGETWTYAELNDNGNRIAQLLLPRVKPGDIVAVYFDKCPEAYFSILGILKAACAFLALDPAAPRARNEFILQDSGASVLLTSKAGKESLELSVMVPTIFVDEGLLSSAPSHPPAHTRQLQPNDVCYCLYTSGTTGTPKGCEITHDNAVQCMLAFQHIFKGHWQEDSRWLQFASLHFDVSVLEQYWSWSVGITLVAAPRDLILEDLAGTVSRLGITHIDLTPSLARLLHPDDVPSLCKGVFITGGEALKQEILDVWGSKGVIYNFYGPTEATIGVTVFPRVPTTGRASNIGKQFVNVGSYVLKPDTQQPVLRGGVGELCVSGRLVGKGYLNREDLTAEKFPTLQQFGDRVYRTGDLVRVLHDGCFDFLGRADDQVKLRGQRLEIGEINHAIRKGVESIQDVATVVVRNESQKKDLLVSFITAGDGTMRKESNTSIEVIDGPGAAELCQRARDACRSKLPGYMVPTYVLQVSFIPLSSNNKAEIKRLAKFFTSLGTDKLMSLSSIPNMSRRALSGTGTRIVAVLATMQKIEPSSVTAESSIFELGIDSITVLRFSRALKNEGFATASPSLILRHPLIRDLAASLETHKSINNSDAVTVAKQLVQACGHKHRAHASRELCVMPDEIEYIAPCSPLQQGMISRSSIDSAYFNTFQFILAPGVSVEHMRNALQRTLDAYAILRTKFVSTADGVVQVALKGTPLSWSEIQLQAGTPIEDAIRDMRNSWIMRNEERLAEPFEVVLINGEGSRLLLIHIFHGLYDANSFNIFLDRLATQYLAGSDESIQVADDAWEPYFIDALCHGPLQDFSGSKAFWMKHLEGATVVHPSKPSTPPPTISITRKVHFGDLDALRTNLGVTHQALVQAAWVSVLAKHRSADPTIGIIVSGRSIEMDNADVVVGPLFNTIPFHAPITTKGGSTWSSLIQQCHEFNTAVLAFQHVPLRDVQKWCSGGQPLFDTLFSFQRDHEPESKHRTLWTAVDSEPRADYPLALEATLASNGSLCLLIVAQDEEAARASALMDALARALTNMARNPSDIVECPSPGLAPKAVLDAAPNDDAANKIMGNGQPQSSAVRPPFEWTKNALIMRNEIADLADMDPQSVPEDVPLLSLGLDSIDVIRLSALLRRKGVNIKASDLMKAQTITAMVELLRSRTLDTNIGDTENAPKKQPIHEATAALREYVREAGGLLDGEVVLPATPLQESMVMEMIKSDFQLYFNHDILELAPSVDVTRMAYAWRTVIAGSPVLRTRFVPVESPELAASYCQVIGDGSSVRMTEVKLNTTEDLATVCYTATLRAQKGGGKSDLLQLVFATDGDQTFLVLSIAHALYDGWSLSLIHQAVHAAYEGTYRAQSLESYTHQLEGVLFQEHGDAASFWAGFLQGVTPTLIPERESGSDQDPLVHRDEVSWPMSVPETMAFCKANAITLQILGQACWAAFLAAKTERLDVTFGVVLSCRDTVSLEELMFPTMNTVPVRSVLHGTISSWIRYMQDNMNSTGPYRHFPLRAAQKLAKSNGPLFNTLFIQQRGIPTAIQAGGRKLMESVGETSRVEYPVCVEMEVTEDKLVWRMACDGAYASPDETLHMLRELNQVLVYIMRSPAASVATFSAEQVSVCGQAPVMLPTAASVPNTVVNQLATEDGGPWSPLEEAIRDVLAVVSGTPTATILRRNNIYHLGLDSISAVKTGSLLRKKGIAIGFRDLLKAESISEMAMLAREAQHIPTPPESANGAEGLTDAFAVPSGVDLPAILRSIEVDESEVEEALPATSMQVHMLSVWQNTHGAVFYPCFQYTLSGPMDATAIARAWETLVAETPILRTMFVSTSSRSTPILQVTIRSSTFHQIQPSVNDTEWHTRTTKHLPPPYNSLHVEKHGESWAVRLKIHHALYDAVSLPAIMERFAALCSSKDIGQSASPAFKCRKLLSRHLSDSGRLVRQQFWTQYLAGTQPQPPRPHQSRGNVSSRVSTIKHTAVQGVSAILDLCKERGVSLQALFFAAYAEFLASTAVKDGAEGPETVVFGIYLANRAESHPGASTYPFLRLVPLRVALRDKPCLFELAAAIQRDIHAISSPAHVEVGLWEIKDWTGVTVDSFVNFLAASPSVPDRRGVFQLELREARAGGDPITHDELDGNFEELSREIASNPARDAFPASDAVDVEVSVQGDSMTIGAFGSAQRLGGGGGDRVIEGVAALLMGVV